jgi:hypothetical protein
MNCQNDPSVSSCVQMLVLTSSFCFQSPAGYDTVTWLVAVGTNMISTLATAAPILTCCLVWATSFQIVTPANWAVAKLQVKVFELLWTTFLSPGQFSSFVDPCPLLRLCGRCSL